MVQVHLTLLMISEGVHECTHVHKLCNSHLTVRRHSCATLFSKDTLAACTLARETCGITPGTLRSGSFLWSIGGSPNSDRTWEATSPRQRKSTTTRPRDNTRQTQVLPPNPSLCIQERVSEVSEPLGRSRKEYVYVTNVTSASLMVYRSLAQTAPQ